MNRTIDRAASARGGSVTTEQSLAKANAVAVAHKARIPASKSRQSSLKPPRPFTSISEFLSAVARISRSLYGARRAIAAECKVNTSTVSKWLTGRKFPTQTNLDAIARWWNHNQKARAKIEEAARPAKTEQGVSLSRLPVPLALRLKEAAKHRGLKPVEYAAQIIDLHLRQNKE